MNGLIVEHEISARNVFIAYGALGQTRDLVAVETHWLARLGLIELVGLNELAARRAHEAAGVVGRAIR